MEQKRQGGQGQAAPGKVVKRAPGPGKQPKKFTEDQGMSHLLALSKQAVDKTDTEYQHRVERTHLAQEKRAQAEKEKRRKKQEAKSTSTRPTKSAMMTLLKEKQRKKLRARRERRHAERQGALSSESVAAQAPAAEPQNARRSILKKSTVRPADASKKQVSFH